MHRKLIALCLPLLLAGTASAAVTGQQAVRAEPGKIAVTWTAKAPVDVYVSDRAEAGVAEARLVSAADRDGRYEMAAEAGARPYFLLKEKGGDTVRVAERVLPLEQSSNFRDIGGYPAAGGKHVRWGMIFRSGGQPMLSPADLAAIGGLRLVDMVDLRTAEERVFAPSRIDGVRYSAVNYSVAQLAAQTPSGGDEAPLSMDRAGQLYRAFPTMLKPQMKVLFSTLLRDEGPMVYNCSAGQDRTGFATALILSALGVPRETIIADYHLSTAYRRPQWEMPKLNPEAYPTMPGVAYFAQFQKDPATMAPKPLYDSQQKSLLAYAFDEIDAKWGSVDAYLDKELGVGPAQIAQLRAEYLE